MLLGVEPGYRGQDERLDKSVLAGALGILGGGMLFLLAMMFLFFPEWISPRVFASWLVTSTAQWETVESGLEAWDENVSVLQSNVVVAPADNLREKQAEDRSVVRQDTATPVIHTVPPAAPSAGPTAPPRHPTASASANPPAARRTSPPASPLGGPPADPLGQPVSSPGSSPGVLPAK
jgi:hypothetical protein